MFAPQIAQPSVPPHYPQGPHDGLQRSNSLTWRHEAGLPPPPSEIDQFPDLQHHMQPSLRNEQAQRTQSPFTYEDTNHHHGEAMSMNSVSKHPKLKLRILLGRDIFEAGSTVSGVLEITASTSQRLRLGEIAVELEAFEELSSRDHAATQIFLFNRTLFQGEHLPPSNAVLPSAPTSGYWTARKGRTTFPFSFRLPVSAPSSCHFGGNASLRYVLKGTAQTWWNETKSVVTVRSEAFVVERWQDELEPLYNEPIEAIADTHVFMGGSGAIWLEAGLTEQLFVAGSKLVIRAGIKNNSKRHLSGVKVCIARKLIFPASGVPGKPAQRPSLEPQITETIHTQVFKGQAYEFPPNEEVVTTLAVDVPREIRSIRKTRLFEVQTVAIVSAQMGNFAKDLTVEIPMYIAHPGSLQHRRATQSHPAAAASPMPPSTTFQPLVNLPQRSRSAMANHGQHQTQLSLPVIASPALPQQAQMEASSPLQQQPLAHQPYHPGLSMAQVEAYAIQRGWSPAPVVMNDMSNAGFPAPARPASAAPLMANGGMITIPSSFQTFANQQSMQWNAPANQPAAQWGPAPPAVSYEPQQRSQPQQLMAMPPIRPVSAQEVRQSAVSGGQNVNTSQLRQQTGHAASPGAQSAVPQTPSRRYSAPASSSDDHQQTVQNKSIIEEPQREEEEEVNIPYVPSPSQLLGPNGQPVGLATIEEDSESAAGTVRSMRTLIGSVSRGDIDQFEEMARIAEDEEQAQKAMRSMGMVPDPRRHQAEALANADKSLPRMPVSATSSSTSKTNANQPKSALQSTSQTQQRESARPKVTEIFTAPTADKVESKQSSLSAAPRPLDTPQAPARPASAQGVGLLALESRLSTISSSDPTTKSKVPIASRKSEPSPSTTTQSTLSSKPVQVMANVGRTSTSQVETRQSPIATASGTGERASKNEDKEDFKRKPLSTSSFANSARKAGEQRLPKVPSTTNNAQSSLSGGDRKMVDVEEQRKLTKEAVGRVNGWLSTSPSRELTNKRHSASRDEEDVALSPKTPSPSVLLAGPEESLPEGSAEEIIPQASSSSVLQTLSQTEARDEEKTHHTGSIKLSADLRALIDGTADLPKPKRTSTISNHPSSRRFSLGVDGQDGKSNVPKPASSSAVSNAKRLPLQEKANDVLPTKDEDGDIQVPASFSKQLLKSTLKAATKEHDGGVTESSLPRYDVRSARGGRGGRVTSVASMWASIADGADGSAQPNDATPVLTLKPKALRTGAVRLDFTSKEQADDERVAARSPALMIVNNKVTSAANKTTGAPHFINTTMPKPVFSSNKAAGQGAIAEMPPSARVLHQQQQQPAHVDETPKEGKLKASRKITSDLVAAEAKMRAGRNLASSAQQVLQIDQDAHGGIGSDLFVSMNGRGTTKPIGRERLADLRSMWGG